MTNSHLQIPPTAPLRLPSIIDIAATSSLQHAFINLLAASSAKIVLDASHVERVATPGIQLFLSFIKAAASSERHISITHPSSTFMSVIEDLGVMNMFKPHLEMA